MPSHAPSADCTTTPVLAQLPEADRAAALACFRVLRPHLEKGMPLAQIAHAGHYIHWHLPEAVIAAIRQVLAALRP